MTSPVVIAGSTGSIGTQALDVVRDTDRFEVVAIGANSSVQLLADQANEFHPRIVAIADETKAKELAALLPAGTELRAGSEALASLTAEADTVVNAVVGFAGLRVTLGALQSGRRLALANKESLIAAGALVKQALQTPGAELLPIDSEHGALHQCLRSETDRGAGDGRAVRKLLLTASGGPFRGRSRSDLEAVTREQALAHPTWQMGPKISIDSSTLFNKGLEVIEAHELFGVDYDAIDVVVHPQSILHSAVEFTDGSVIGQLSNPDMRLPIGYAMGHPSRLDVPYGTIDWTKLADLHFEAPDRAAFPCLDLAFAAGRSGGVATTWLNAANEVAVDAFLNGAIRWIEISEVIEKTISEAPRIVADSLEIVENADAEARIKAREIVSR